jgi:broad specificity phosphatase PhoE
MATRIMLVRHGEKPSKRDQIRGVDPQGKHDKKELSPRGWQRSGALVRFFNPMKGNFSHQALARPNSIYAANPQGDAKSERSKNTVQALADSLGMRVTLRYKKGQEEALVKAVLAQRGVVLIAWEHNAILKIANMIAGNEKTSPQRWPDSRFDLVWVFDAGAGGRTWKFTQVAQMLLPGDKPKTL